MSFSSQVKQEICSQYEERKDCRRAMCYGMLLFGKRFSEQKIAFVTENESVAKTLLKLIIDTEKLSASEIEVQKSKKGSGHIFNISVKDPQNCERIFLDFSFLGNNVTQKINRALLENEASLRAFIKGAFLSCGAVTSPQKDYHLEFTVPYKNLCTELCRLLSEPEDAPLNLKTVSRRGAYVAYCKDSEKISDFVVYLGAGMSAMEIIQEKIYKEVVNDTNRKINSEIANINKTINASEIQIDAIKKIQSLAGIESLPDELREVALLRLENPELSLADLAKEMSAPISRSGINHRLKKIIKFSEEL